MSIKPFAIQGSDLTLGGVNLQAGSNGVVIPGVTRAATFKVEQVDERDGANPDTFGSNEGAVTVIDNSRYLQLTGTAPSGSYVAATYSVGELDDGEIHEINVESEGVFAAADKTRVEAANMWATTTPTPFVSFNSANWTQIPYRPKIQANAVENVGGSGGVVERSIEFPAGAEGDTAGTLALTPGGNLYICKTDWVDYSDAGGSYGGLETTEEYLPGQSGFVSNIVTIPLADVPSELLYILQNVAIVPSDWSVIMDDEEFGGEQTCTDVGFNTGGNPSFSWPYRDGTDPNGIPAGSGFTVAYSGTVPQPAIWEQVIIGNTITNNDGGITLNANGDVTLISDDDILLESDDDIRITADDDIRIRTYTSNVNIITDYDGADYTWNFDDTGVLHLPAGGDILDSNGNSVLGGGSSSDPRVWVQTFVTIEPATDFPQIATSVEYDADGNVVVLFNHLDTDTAPDSRYSSVGKFTATGSRIWTVRFAAGLNTDGWGLAVDSVDNWIYIAGSTDDGTSYTVSTLTKIDGGTGNIEWSKVYDFGFESSSAVVDVDSDGQPVMVGYVDLDPVLFSDESYLTITKINKTNGNVTWSRKLDGQADERAYGMAVGPNDEVVAVGYMDQLAYGDIDNAVVTVVTEPVSNANWITNTTAVIGNVDLNITFNAGVPTIVVSNDVVGNRTVGGTIGTLQGSVFGGTNGIDDMVIKVATISGSGDTDDRMVVVKYLDNGSIVWQKAIQFDAGWACSGADADIDSAGNVYICGQYTIDNGGFTGQGIGIVKLNSSGVKQWSRRVVGDCTSSATSIVVGPDDKLYISGITGNNSPNYTWVVAKYSLDGLVEWQRLVDNTTTWSFTGSLFNGGGNGGGSNLAVRQDYVALAGGFGDLEAEEQPYATVVQVPDTGNVFTVGNWDFTAAGFSGNLSSDASDVTVINAGLTDSDNISAISVGSITLMDDVSNFLVGTLFTAPSSNDSINNGDYSVSIDNNGVVSMETSRGNLEFGALPEPGGVSHFHVMRALGDNFDLYFGDDFNYVLQRGGNSSDGVLNDYGVEIGANDLDGGDQHSWRFGTDGNLTIPGNIKSTTDTSILTGNTYSPITGITVRLIDELVPPGDVWRIFIIDGANPELGLTVQVGDTVTTSWGTPITATITEIVQLDGDWRFHVTQNVLTGFNPNSGSRTVTFNSTTSINTWTFDTDGDLTLPAGGDIKDSNGDSVLGGGTGNGFTLLADGTLQANTDNNIATLTSTLQGGRPTWLTITPRSPDRNTLDTHYGFNSTGMWFAGDNEETFNNAPAYPIHTTDSFPADVKTVVEFDFNYVDGEEDWGICVYPADGIPHWNWGTHPSRIAAMIDLGDGSIQIEGLTDSTSRDFDPATGIHRARFTYDPVAELTTMEAIVAGQVVARCQQPGRLARNQDYRIGFDADWDDATGPTEKSYFSNLTITSGNTTDAKATELTVTGEIKLPNTNKGFVNIQGPWDNGDDDIHFQTVVAHDGFAYMGGEASWNDTDTVRLDKYSLTTGELVWTRVLGAGRGAIFNISWTGGVYTIDSIANDGGTGYKTGELLYINGGDLGGDQFLNRATITVTDVNNSGEIQTATIAGTAPAGDGSSTYGEYHNDGHSDPMSIKYDTVSDTVVMLNQQFTIAGDADDLFQDRAVIVRVNPVSGDVVSTVTLSDEGDIRPYDVAIHPTTGVTAVVGEKYNEYRQFGTLTMAVKADGYFDILKSNLDPEHYPGTDTPGEFYEDFWISGTGITGKENIDNVNYYENVSSTTRQGTGATFNITNNGNGTYSAGIETGGTNYLVGHKIKILGTALTGQENTTSYGAAEYGGGYGAWKATDDGAGNTYLIFPQPAGSTAVTGLLSVGDAIIIEWSGTEHTTTIAAALGAVPNDPYIGSFPNSQGYRLTDNFSVTGQPDLNVGYVTIGNGTYAAGATPDNDIIITVDAITGSGIIDSVSNTGTAAGTSTAQATELTGTNYQVGSGFTLNITVDAVTGSRIADVNLGGSNYVANDVAVIPGTVFAGGATPANDVEVTIVSIGEAGGNVTSAVTAGTTPTNIIRIYVNGVDFTVVDGAWTMKQDLAGEAFVWTPTWNKAIGGASNDRFRSVVYSKDGASIYAVGEGRYEVDYDQSLVVKYATSDGTIEFSKYLNSGTTISRAFGVATIGTSDIVVSGYEYIGTTSRYTQFVARMTSSGTVVWKKLLINTWPEGIDQRNDIQVDSDDNIYVTISYQADTPGFTSNGFHVTKLDQAGNVVWSRCVNAPTTSSSLGYGNGNRWSSLHNDQLVVAGYTYATGDDYASGLWASFPTDGFTYLGGEGDFVQMGAFRFSQGSIYVTETLIPGASSFTPSVQAPTITATDNLKKYETRDPIDFFEQHLHKMVDPKHGGVMFGDGSRQTFATDIMPQIKADRGYTITAQDSGKHIYYKNNSGTITIPAEDGGIVLPVGFTFTIINRTGSDCFVRLYDTQGPTRGTILGSGRNASYYEWGIPDSGSGSMVTLIKLESLLISNGGSDIHEPVWMISGPDDIYPDD